jgi:hypothetical protein
MFRVCAIVLVAYNCGYPGLASVRPAAFDEPLTSFHNEVNAAIGEAVAGARIAGEKVLLIASNGAERAKHELAGNFSDTKKN